MLAHEETGPGDAERLVLVHGFTQNRRCWGDVVDRLARRRRVVTVDAPGHGGSREVIRDLWGTADLLAGLGPATFVGYSMGGRMCLHVALAHPRKVERLVLVGATAGIDDPAERERRRRADEALAEEIVTLGIDRFLERWLANPLFADLTPETARLAERRTNDPAALAAALRATGTGTQEPLWDRLGELAMPVLVVVGADDHRFLPVAERLGEAIPTATVAVVPGAAHNVPLARPDVFAELVEEFCDRHPRRGAPGIPAG